MIFYKLQEKEKSSFDYAEGNDWEGITCSIEEGHQRAGKRITILTVEQTKKKVVDFSWTILSDIIISNRVLDLFKKEKIKGFRAKPIKILNTGNFNENKYWELEINGNGGNAGKESKIYLKEKCDSCGLEIYSAYENGIYINEENWDQTDIFKITEYPKMVFVTEKVKKLIEFNKLTNIIFIETTKMKWPKNVIKP